MKNLKNVILGIGLASILIAGCQKEDLNEPILVEKEATQSFLKDTSTSKDDKNRAVVCDNNMTNDGCQFTSGESLDVYQAQYFEPLLDNCYTETLENNCSWMGNYTVKQQFYIYFDACCTSYTVMNSRLNGIKASAQSFAPSNYLIIDYRIFGGVMLNYPYGPKRYTVEVTYRKKICSLSPQPELPAKL